MRQARDENGADIEADTESKDEMAFKIWMNDRRSWSACHRLAGDLVFYRLVCLHLWRITCWSHWKAIYGSFFRMKGTRPHA